jgi:hypothetical protein
LGDQPIGVLALGVERVDGDHGCGQVQALQQRPEPGDLVGGAVDVGLGEDRMAGVVHHRQQVHRRGCVVAGAAQGLAVDRGLWVPETRSDALSCKFARGCWATMIGP